MPDAQSTYPPEIQALVSEFISLAQKQSDAELSAARKVLKRNFRLRSEDGFLVNRINYLSYADKLAFQDDAKSLAASSPHASQHKIIDEIKTRDNLSSLQKSEQDWIISVAKNLEKRPHSLDLPARASRDVRRKPKSSKNPLMTRTVYSSDVIERAVGAKPALQKLTAALFYEFENLKLGLECQALYNWDQTILPNSNQIKQLHRKALATSATMAANMVRLFGRGQVVLYANTTHYDLPPSKSKMSRNLPVALNS